MEMYSYISSSLSITRLPLIGPWRSLLHCSLSMSTEATQSGPKLVRTPPRIISLYILFIRKYTTPSTTTALLESTRGLGLCISPTSIVDITVDGKHLKALLFNKAVTVTPVEYSERLVLSGSGYLAESE